MSVTMQRDQALARANQIRAAGRSLKEDLAGLGPDAALRELARLLRDDPEQLASVRVYRVLKAVPRFGDSQVRRLLTRSECPIWPLKQCRELTERQRCWLAGQLERMAARRGR